MKHYDHAKPNTHIKPPRNTSLPEEKPLLSLFVHRELVEKQRKQSWSANITSSELLNKLVSAKVTSGCKINSRLVTICD